MVLEVYSMKWDNGVSQAICMNEDCMACWLRQE
jgi:hypothetical protein